MRALRLLPADADRKLGRARAALRAIAQEPLDDPVLERVEADDGEPAARPQHLERRRETDLERLELVVDRDPQRLEDALRGMPLAEARRRRNRGPDDVDELPVRSIGSSARRRTIAARDLARVALLAVAAEDRSPARARRRSRRRRPRWARRTGPCACRAARRSRTRSRARAGRPASRRRRGRAGSRPRARRCPRAARARRRSRRAGTASARRASLAFTRSKYGRTRRVAVDRDELPAPLQVGGEQARVAARAEGGIDDRLSRLHVEELAHLVREHGDVISRVCPLHVRQHLRRSLRSR